MTKDMSMKAISRASNKDGFFGLLMQTSGILSFRSISKLLDKKIAEEELTKLEAEWYKNVNKKPKYSLYNSDFYIYDLWLCWYKYSRTYIKKIVSPKGIFFTDESGERRARSIIEDIGEAKTIVDLGCGIGATTMALAEVFDGAKVYATNIPNTFQWKLCQKLAAIEQSFMLVDNVDKISGEVDMVFASEYFEHFQEPIKHLQHILDTIDPRTMIVANAFTAKALGHFDMYKINGEIVTGKQASKAFNAFMRSRGYKKMKTNLFNDRPSYWVKQ